MSKLKLDPGFSLARYHFYYVSVDRFAGSHEMASKLSEDLVIPFDRWLNSGMGF